MSKRLAIVLTTFDSYRASEALRAAIGVAAHGINVRVFASDEVQQHIRQQPQLSRSIATLELVGVAIEASDQFTPTQFDAVETWTSGLERTNPTTAVAATVPPCCQAGATPVVDLRGERCPFTFVHAKLALEPLLPGEKLGFVYDHKPASENVPRSLTQWGQRVLLVEEHTSCGQHWLVVAERV